MNSEQLTLTLAPLAAVEVESSASIQERFEAFHVANPWIYAAFVELTADWLARGHLRLGIGMLTEIVRWQYSQQTNGDDFRINNNFRSRYVRLLIQDHPQWARAFETRELRAA